MSDEARRRAQRLQRALGESYGDDARRDRLLERHADVRLRVLRCDRCRSSSVLDQSTDPHEVGRVVDVGGRVWSVAKTWVAEVAGERTLCRDCFDERHAKALERKTRR